MTDKVLTLNDAEYEAVPEVVVAGSRWLVDIWEKLGRPESPLSESGVKLMNVIIASWEELYPSDARKWYEDRKMYKNNELTITEQVHKHTGRSLASYPYPVFAMMSKLFPKFKFGQRDNCIKLVKKFPMFKMVNKI